MREKEINYPLNALKYAGIVGSIIITALIEAYLAPYTEFWIGDLIYIENFGWGLIGIICYGIMYCAPSRKFLFRYKLFWLYMAILSTCWIWIDWQDFILFLRG